MKSDINDLCEAFLAALTNAGYAVKSIENYKQVSNRFKKFCAENGYDTYTVNIGQIFADNVFNEETGAFVGYRNVMYGRFVRLINSFYMIALLVIRVVINVLDKRSRKVLKYIERHGQASFSELIKLDRNDSLMTLILCKLHTGEYIIRVANEYEGRREAVYELQEKGYGVLEDYRRQAIYAYGPMLISLTALVISILSYFR